MKAPSPEFREQLRKVFGVKHPDKPKNPVMLPIHDKPKAPEKGIGSPGLSYQAQQIYNPNLPPLPSKPPTAPQVNRGTVGALGMNGQWGMPAEEK